MSEYGLRGIINRRGAIVFVRSQILICVYQLELHCEVQIVGIDQSTEQVYTRTLICRLGNAATKMRARNINNAPVICSWRFYPLCLWLSEVRGAWRL